jgi:hypothetical protein
MLFLYRRSGLRFIIHKLLKDKHFPGRGGRAAIWARKRCNDGWVIGPFFYAFHMNEKDRQAPGVIAFFRPLAVRGYRADG